MTDHLGPTMPQTEHWGAVLHLTAGENAVKNIRELNVKIRFSS